MNTLVYLQVFLHIHNAKVTHDKKELSPCRVATVIVPIMLSAKRAP